MAIAGDITKCVILARGLGTRMRSRDPGAPLNLAQSAAATAGLKAMIPVGRPFMDYVLSALADAGFQHACLVIGPQHSVVRQHYTGVHRPTRIQVTFAIQTEALGTANAVLAAEGFAGTDEFLTLNGDNYYPVEVLSALQALCRPGTVLFETDTLVRESNIPAERVWDFAFAVIDADGFLAELMEKPDAKTAASLADPKLVSMNCWRFDSGIFPVCREIPLSPRGEYELPLAVRLAIQRGMKLKVSISRAGVLDLSRRLDIPAVTDRLRNVKVQL